MRVIAGKAKGCPLKAVPGMGTRPTTDKVKEAIFSMIGPYFDRGNVLDLFAGTGGMGIEALSRGMTKGIFVDIERKSIDVISFNLERSRLTDLAEVYRNDAERALHVLGKRGIHFDLIILDPPYHQDVITKLLMLIDQKNLLSNDGMIVLEYGKSNEIDVDENRFHFHKQVNYGDTTVAIVEKVDVQI
ncbi:MAG: 16S rRNA (guanine(966)-N(2))-methyltransferase RsmD [Bacilli bacterium]